MTEAELRRSVCRQAQLWLGRRESDGGHREIIDLYNQIRPLPRGYRMGYDDPWCAAFVSAVGAACGLTSVLLPECGCEPMIALYRAAGRWEEADEAVPRPGDLIFYDWQDAGAGDCRGEADHVGLVTENDDDLLTVVEGNLSHAVGTRRIYAGARFIRGFARPDYAAAAQVPPRTEAEAPVPADRAPDGSGDPPRSSPALLPTLRRGGKGPAVRAAQLLLICRGFRCGPAGADGDFGPATFGAVTRFQQAKKLMADGVVGPLTWAALVGGLEEDERSVP